MAHKHLAPTHEQCRRSEVDYALELETSGALREAITLMEELRTRAIETFGELPKGCRHHVVPEQKSQEAERPAGAHAGRYGLQPRRRGLGPDHPTSRQLRTLLRARITKSKADA